MPRTDRLRSFGLSPEENYFIELKRRLADDLRKRRARRKISQQQLATLIGSSQSRVAEMERGDASVSIDLLVKSLRGGREAEGSGAIDRGLNRGLVKGVPAPRRRDRQTRW